MSRVTMTVSPTWGHRGLKRDLEQAAVTFLALNTVFSQCPEHLSSKKQEPWTQAAGRSTGSLSPRQRWNRGTKDVQEACAAGCAAPFPFPQQRDPLQDSMSPF